VFPYELDDRKHRQDVDVEGGRHRHHPRSLGQQGGQIGPLGAEQGDHFRPQPGPAQVARQVDAGQVEHLGHVVPVGPPGVPVPQLAERV
jgi:hypothetical protein